MRRATGPESPSAGRRIRSVSKPEERNAKVKRWWRVADDVNIDILGESRDREETASIVPWMRKRSPEDEP